jgi:hypothetical protein
MKRRGGLALQQASSPAAVAVRTGQEKRGKEKKETRMVLPSSAVCL